MSEKNSVPASCVEIVLSVPYVTASGQTITHVTMRAPTVRDRLLHRRSTKPEAEADLDMIAGLCGMDAAGADEALTSGIVILICSLIVHFLHIILMPMNKVHPEFPCRL